MDNSLIELKYIKKLSIFLSKISYINGVEIQLILADRDRSISFGKFYQKKKKNSFWLKELLEINDLCVFMYRE